VSVEFSLFLNMLQYVSGSSKSTPGQVAVPHMHTLYTNGMQCRGSSEWHAVTWLGVLSLFFLSSVMCESGSSRSTQGQVVVPRMHTMYTNGMR
jgi:hypothetical protein